MLKQADYLSRLGLVFKQKSDYLFKDSSEFYAAHAAIKKATAK